jgi:phage-related protein
MSTGGEEPRAKDIVWLHGEVRTPPFSRSARSEAGALLRRLQDGETIGMPHSRPMPSVGPRCHELRVRDENATWRIIYRIDPDAIHIGEVFSKKTQKTPDEVIARCKARFAKVDATVREAARAEKQKSKEEQS